MLSKRDVEATIQAANPLDPASVGGLTLGAATAELLATIVAQPQDAPGPGAAAALRGSRRPPLRGRYLALVPGVCLAAALFLTLFSSRGGPAGTPEQALADDLARLAAISPPILIDAPGWRVVVATEQHATEGETEFQRGARPQPGPRRLAKLWWRSDSPQQRMRQLTSRGALAVAAAPVLGTRARVYAYPHRDEDVFEAIALWRESGRAFEFRASVPNVATFKRRLATLRSVERSDWIAALRRFERSSARLQAEMVTGSHSMKWSVVRTPPPSWQPKEEK